MNRYNIPPRINKSQGFLGSISNSDAIKALTCIAIGLTLFLVVGQALGLILFVIFGGGGYLLFIFPDPYKENMMIKIQRMQKFNKKQKRYYYYRGT